MLCRRLTDRETVDVVVALPRAAASRVDSWFGSDAVDKRTTTFAGTPRPTLSALPRKRRYQIECMRYCAYFATPPTSDSQYQCARSGIDYIGLREFEAQCDV